MSLKAELETWGAALKAYDEEEYEKALQLFSRIADSSKILTNMGLIYAALGEHEAAVEQFIEATSLDSYLAVAYFQCGVSNFLLTRYELAHKDFDEALLYLRGNEAINYEQLGLKFRLFSAEVLFNRGLAHIYLGRMDEGLADMREAKAVAVTPDHGVIADAISDRGEGYTVFSIPVGVLYRPAEKKLANTKTKDFIGKAKLIATSDARDTTTGFSGIDRKNQGLRPSGVYIDSVTSPGLASNPASTASESAPPDPPPKIEDSSTRPGGDGGPPPIRVNTALSPISTRPPPFSARHSPGSATLQVLKARSPQRPPQTAQYSDPARLTEIYDDYIEDPAPVVSPRDRVGAWARTNAAAPPPPAARTPPHVRTPPPSSFPSSFSPSLARQPSGGFSLSRQPSSASSSPYSSTSGRRRLVRRNTARRMQEEEEEGYASGEDYDFELVKIRVKLHYAGDTRGMALVPEMPFDEFMDRVTMKFNVDIDGLALKFKDEDGVHVSLRDAGDYELAIETARESAKGMPEGKLEIWCEDRWNE
ncbi:NADPH oxidase regulator NoxR [Mycena rebaudengoi]|nr:NADPH oxidase regulator NoxR [Mycena rebaudengoi]